MKIATWNVNGIKARIHALPGWLQAAAPDAVALQEIKTLDEGFPREEIEALGYRVESFGQKSFNGVAILSKRPLENVARGLPGDPEDEQSRWIEADVIGERGSLRFCALYLPNGDPSPGPKYDYKLAWMERLRRRALDLLRAERPAALLGDFNVIPQDLDAAHPADWRESALGRPESRAAYRRILHQGWTEAWRALRPRETEYSYWDFQRRAWEKNDGIRIDHILLSPQAADRLRGAGIDKDLRDGPKPSDHVPVWAYLSL